MSSPTITAGERRDSLGVGFQNMRRSRIRGPARTGRGVVLMAGGRQGQCAGKGESVRGRRLPSLPCFFSESTCVFRLSVLMKEVASKYPFYILIYMNSSSFHFGSILFIFLSKTNSVFGFICHFRWSTHMVLIVILYEKRLSKYAHTYIRRYTHKKKKGEKVQSTKTKRLQEVGGGKKKRVRKGRSGRECLRGRRSVSNEGGRT